jgi:hydroxymethylbilane synthase
MNPEMRTLVIGTRGSQLAVWQAEHVAARLGETFPGMSVRLERIRTTGDRILDVPLAQVGGKALFVKEIEEALLAGRVDLAVHSMKDVPADLPAGLIIGAIPLREIPADVLISRTGQRLAEMPRGARVGTSSLRRQSQLLQHRPDLVVVGLRGNLDTRIRKLNSEGLDAVVLAAAGVRRLGLDRLVTETLPPEIVLPAIGQGALGIEIRVPSAECRVPSGGEDEGRATSHEPRATNREMQGGTGAGGPGSDEGRDATVAECVKSLDHADTHTAVRAERAMLQGLGGGCQVPIAALATVEGTGVFLRGLVASTDGVNVIRGEAHGNTADPDAVGRALAGELLERGGRVILQGILGGDVHG